MLLLSGLTVQIAAAQVEEQPVGLPLEADTDTDGPELADSIVRSVKGKEEVDAVHRLPVEEEDISLMTAMFC